MFECQKMLVLSFYQEGSQFKLATSTGSFSNNNNNDNNNNDDSVVLKYIPYARCALKPRELFPYLISFMFSGVNCMGGCVLC